MDGGLVDCNDSFARIFGFATGAEMLGQNTHSFDRSLEDRPSLKPPCTNPAV